MGRNRISITGTQLFWKIKTRHTQELDVKTSRTAVFFNKFNLAHYNAV